VRAGVFLLREPSVHQREDSTGGSRGISMMLAFFVICIGVESLWESIQALRS
jgi:hypothetical protein